MKAIEKAVIAIDDESILRLFEARDQQALEETSAQYGTLCRTVANNILESAEDAEECLNDALLAAWNAIPPAHPDNFRAYLLRLVRNLAINRWHAAKRQKRVSNQLADALDELSESLPARENVEQELDKRALSSAIVTFLSGLPQQQRDLFVRRYWYASSVSECASLFGMTENNVKVSLSRIRKRMQDYLRKEGFL